MVAAGMLLVIDNYDSFTYNLVQYLGELGVEMRIFRNDETTPEQIRRLKPDRILISPGPCSPREAGLSNDIIKIFSKDIPTLGVCLGHQCIGHVFGAEVVRAERLMHGKTSPIWHTGDPLFAGLPNPFTATRYHSLLIKRDTIPPELAIIAETRPELEVMGVRHKKLPIWGVQFHPESILTEHGKQILANFLKLTG
jgi:anthranilate synthase/aminodeoxychorismate synthase-like glutamine amidotransferase